MSNSKPVQKSALNIILGSMTFGAPHVAETRVSDLEEIEAVLDIFQAHGHDEIDSARTYCQATCEEVLGQTTWKKRGIKLDTKLSPTAARSVDGSGIRHTEEDLRKHLDISLKALGTDQLEMWYLHAPDRAIPYEVTLKCVKDLYKEGKFKRFGISNYSAWEVAEMVSTRKVNGYIQPTAYQGIYNAIHRGVEPELFPCLRKFGISFYEFNALGGGFFTGRYKSVEEEPQAGRFDPSKGQGKNYRARYWNEHYFKAVNSIQELAEKHNLAMAEIALRWISHHSLMKREHGDAVIIGASSTTHIEQNLIDLEKGPLPDDVVSALDEVWATVKPHASSYFRVFK